MADQPISTLTEVFTPLTTDVVPIVNSSTTKRVQISNLVKLGNVAIWARAYHNTSQSLAHNTPLILNFNSERFDTDTIHDTATNNERLTCKTAGVYAICASVQFASHATGYRAVNLTLNGATTISGIITPANSGVVTQVNVAAIYALAVNDYVTVTASQTSGGALNVDTAANYSPEFMMVRLGG